MRGFNRLLAQQSDTIGGIPIRLRTERSLIFPFTSTFSKLLTGAFGCREEHGFFGTNCLTMFTFHV